MTTYTIQAPGTWCRDIASAMEDHAYDLDRGAWDNDPMHAAVTEVVEQFEDDTRKVKRGRGFTLQFDLTSIEAVRFIRDEAVYRFEFQGGNRNPYGNESRDSKKKAAAREVLDQCDAILAEVQS